MENLTQLNILFLVFVISTNTVLAIIVLFNNPKMQLNRIYSFLSFVISLWVLSNFLSVNPALTSRLLEWARLSLFFAVPMSTLFFLFTYRISLPQTIIKPWHTFVVFFVTTVTMFIAISPLTFSNLIVTGEGITPVIGPGMTVFSVVTSIFSLLSLSVLFYGIRIAKKNKDKIELERLNIVFAAVAIILILIITTVLLSVVVFNNSFFVSFIPIYTLIFLSITAYAVIKGMIFSVKLIATQLLVYILNIILFSQIFVSVNRGQLWVPILIFVVSTSLGFLLIRSVKNEVRQRERLEILTGELKIANENLKDLIKQKESLVYLINHKVKGSFTHTKYIFAELLDGAFGVLTPELKKIAELGLESDENGIKTVDLILNSSNLQKGIVEYDMKSLDIKEIIKNVIEEKKVIAEKKGLKIKTEISNDDCIVKGDGFWLKEVINNLLDNSIKYTKEGEIEIGLKKENNKILFYVKDTGIGITDEDKKNLFTEGGRGKNSVKVNVDSTGYGLYTVKLITEAHNGRVWIESEGEGKGSQSFVELDAI